MARQRDSRTLRSTLLQRLWGWIRGGGQVFELPEPRAEVLDDIPGGEPNLLHKLQLREDLRIEFDLWQYSEPTPDAPDVLELYFDALTQAVVTRQWTAPISADQLFVLLPKAYLTQGTHVIWYRVTLGGTGASSDSLPLLFTVNTTVPDLGGERGLLQFPAELAQGLSAHYLESHGDQVEAVMPDHYPRASGDVVTWYWEQQPVGSQKLGEYTLGVDDLVRPLVLTFSGEQIRALGDGLRYVSYDISSRAGFVSRLSAAAVLQVAATPVPRYWPAVTVLDSNSAPVLGTLNPLNALSGVTVRVPAEAVLYADEVVLVQWAVAGSVGATEVAAVIVGSGPWLLRIAKDYIGAHMGKRLSVRYRLRDNPQLPPSTELSLTVGNLPQASLAAVQSKTGAQGSGRISLAKVPAAGDELSLARWPLIAEGQRLKLWAEGTLSSGVSSTHWLYNDVAVTSAQASRGVTTLLARSWFTGLRLNSPVHLRAAVSFDRGQSWAAFSEIEWTLVV